MTRKTSFAERAMTLEEYRALNPARPLTDRPIGALTASKRHADAMASEAVTPSTGRLTTPTTRKEPA